MDQKTDEPFKGEPLKTVKRARYQESGAARCESGRGHFRYRQDYGPNLGRD